MHLQKGNLEVSRVSLQVHECISIQTIHTGTIYTYVKLCVCSYSDEGNNVQICQFSKCHYMSAYRLNKSVGYVPSQFDIRHW